MQRDLFAIAELLVQNYSHNRLARFLRHSVYTELSYELLKWSSFFAHRVQSYNLKS